MLKKLLIFVLIIIILAIAAGAGVFYYRYSIIQYSVDKVVRGMLPSYVTVDSIKFEFKNNMVVVRGFRIHNPRGFSNKYLLEVEEITCEYRLMRKNILDGIEILRPVLKDAVMTIERSADGKINATEMRTLTEKAPDPAKAQNSPIGAGGRSQAIGDKKLPEMIKLPETFSVRNGKVVFIDRAVGTKPHMITLENVEAQLLLVLDASYSRALRAGSRGKGNFNGNNNETITWDVSLNPTTPGLTMSNRFEVSGVDIVSFEPYYDRYSPFVFKEGRFAGELIFDFDNDNIGSTNQIRLSGLRFYIKQDFENAQYWEANVDDLIKYFTTASGEIVLDFKIKGNMDKPKFYLGPISKQAITSLAIDKISDVLQSMSKKAQEGVADPTSQIDKFQEYLKTFQGIVDKKQ